MANKIKKLNIKKCQDLQDIRNHIDALDEIIIPLLCERIQYVTQAAQFKKELDHVRIFGRIEAIVQRAVAYANVLGADPEHIEAVYRNIIDESIRQERKHWQQINQDSSI